VVPKSAARSAQNDLLRLFANHGISKMPVKEREHLLSRSSQRKVASRYPTMIVASNPDATVLKPRGMVRRMKTMRRPVMIAETMREPAEGGEDFVFLSTSFSDADDSGFEPLRRAVRSTDKSRVVACTKIAKHMTDPRKIQYCLRYSSCLR
jgi:hypothetical protein